MSKEKHGSGVETIERDSVKTREPALYKVFLLNDDYTTMDFVVAVLESVFNKSPAEAVKIMLSVHHQGRGLCGIFTKQIAEAKLAAVHSKARAQGHPLKCVMEQA